MNAKELFRKAAEQATECIRQVDEVQLANGTPCNEWSLKDLINHMVYETLWVPEITQGKTTAEVGDRYEGDVLGTDFKQSWKHAIDAALVAVKQADETAAAHLSYADKPMNEYIEEIASDLFIHAWDVATAASIDSDFDEDVAEVVYKMMLPRKDEMAASGVFGSPVEVDAKANTLTKLLALTGRKE